MQIREASSSCPTGAEAQAKPPVITGQPAVNAITQSSVAYIDKKKLRRNVKRLCRIYALRQEETKLL